MKTKQLTLPAFMKLFVLSLFFLSFTLNGFAQNISSMSLSEIEAKTKVASDAGDYDKAAQWKEVGELKKELDQAVQNSDYAKASQLKKEMDEHPVSGTSTAVPPPAQPKTETSISPIGSNYNPPPASSTSGGTTDKTAFLYQFGSYTPLGFMMAGETSKGVGIYFALRASVNIFNGSSIYDMSNGSIDDDYWRFTYTRNKEYRRWSATMGLSFKLAGSLDGFSLHGYTGLGYGQALYFYEFEQIGPGTGTSYGNEWVKDADQSIGGLEFEFGTIIDIYGFALSFGWTTLNFKESMLTMGIGGAF